MNIQSWNITNVNSSFTTRHIITYICLVLLDALKKLRIKNRSNIQHVWHSCSQFWAHSFSILLTHADENTWDMLAYSCCNKRSSYTDTWRLRAAADIESANYNYRPVLLTCTIETNYMPIYMDRVTACRSRNDNNQLFNCFQVNYWFYYCKIANDSNPEISGLELRNPGISGLEKRPGSLDFGMQFPHKITFWSILILN
jgi:hypothetical protein